MKNCFAAICVKVGLVSLAMVSLAHAQATRTWVSGLGDDVNPCSRTAPCKTFAGAISKTAANGEISVLDPGGYGGLTITKAITINGDAVLGSVLVSGTNGITVQAGASDVVHLRSISLVGAGAGLNGIRYTSGGSLVIEKCAIYGFPGNGIDVALTAPGNLVVSQTNITGMYNSMAVSSGVHVSGTSGLLSVSLDHVSISGFTNGVDVLYGAVQMSNSVITQNSGVAALAEAGSLTVENSLLTNNGTGGQASPGATLRVSANGIYDNLTGFGCGGGTIASAGNNRKAGNTGGSTPCTPAGTITLQ